MRAKLLRALAHLKAASRHVAIARDILGGRGVYWHAGHDAGKPVDDQIDLFVEAVKEHLADKIYAHVEPVNLP